MSRQRTPTPARRGLSGRTSWWSCLVVSPATAAVGVFWMTAPASYPYGHGDTVRTGFNQLIEREAGVTIALAAGALGLVVAVMGLLGETRSALRIAGVGAAAEALCFAFVLGDGSIIALLGYGVAVAFPFGAVTVLVLVGRRWPRAGAALCGVALTLVAFGLVSGTLVPLGEAFGAYAARVVTGISHDGRLLWTLGWLAGAACWAWAAVTSVRGAWSSQARSSQAWSSRAGAGSPPPAWTAPAAVRRWGRTATIVAALCPVPYGLARLTWVTPWPLGGRGIEDFVISGDMDLGTRIQGFMFAPAVAVGVLLTLGLIRRWGEVFPRWVPGLSGRPVPIRLAVVPGTLVAAAITVSAPGILLMGIEDGDPLEFALTFLAFPFPIWGPALGAAVFAYWLRRTGLTRDDPREAQ